MPFLIDIHTASTFWNFDNFTFRDIYQIALCLGVFLCSIYSVLTIQLSAVFLKVNKQMSLKKRKASNFLGQLGKQFLKYHEPGFYWL